MGSDRERVGGVRGSLRRRTADGVLDGPAVVGPAQDRHGVEVEHGAQVVQQTRHGWSLVSTAVARRASAVASARARAASALRRAATSTRTLTVAATTAKTTIAMMTLGSSMTHWK